MDSPVFFFFVVFMTTSFQFDLIEFQLLATLGNFGTTSVNIVVNFQSNER